MLPSREVSAPLTGVSVNSSVLPRAFDVRSAAVAKVVAVLPSLFLVHAVID